MKKESPQIKRETYHEETKTLEKQHIHYSDYEHNGSSDYADSGTNRP